MRNDRQTHLNSRDFLVLLAMAYIPEGPPGPGSTQSVPADPLGSTDPPRPWTYQSLAELLGMSPSQTHKSIQTLSIAGLLHGKAIRGKVDRGAMAEFIIHGARYAFPARVGAETRGYLTGVHSTVFEPENLIVETAPIYVWPSPRGRSRGQGVIPLCSAVITCHQKDSRLYRALAYFDVLRLGSAREREIATRFFQESLAWRS